ncbi:nitrogen fixation negative regulator NifL [Vibrio algarum]|uniref:Nitrogen fixation negative regulator NifL n=1 Tax=Vibrio algarum TaxID=3020714 RepID=A0ABT4YSV0_9VIBR|nr:nitrogen fixation negative regulator NifL [Vibrio sp. KJ40-1]MDB1124139.1 nitrogen fixation negative regulator NifL [Vibrio sp. KJ40-1]
MKQLDNLDVDSFDYRFGHDAFKQILLTAPVAITITDTMGNILMVNPCFTEITGYSEDELVGKNCSILSYKTTPENVYNNLWATISNGDHWQGQLINKKKSGDLYIADISISGFRNENGESFYYAIHKDITEKVQLQTQQKNQSAMFEAVLNSAPIAIALIDSNNKVLLSNKLYQDLTTNLGEPPIQLLRKYLKFDHGYDSIDAFMGTKQKHSQGIHINSTHSSIDRWFDAAFAKIPVTDTAAEAYFHPTDEFYTVVGITERTKEKRHLEERRVNAIKLMASDNKYVHAMQEAMMATLHQLQGPFNMIESAVNMLKKTITLAPV